MTRWSDDAIVGVSRETRERLEIYGQLYDKWSSRINLTASSTQNDFWSRHIADSAQLLVLAPAARHWTDLGSGAGFPGMVVAILLEGMEGARIDLVESNRKKTGFLHAVKAACAPSTFIHANRIESVTDVVPIPEVVTARALARLPKLFELASPWLCNGAKALFHKGRGYASEIEESHANWSFDLLIHKSRIDTESVILEISGLSRKTS